MQSKLKNVNWYAVGAADGGPNESASETTGIGVKEPDTPFMLDAISTQSMDGVSPVEPDTTHLQLPGLSIFLEVADIH